MNDSIQNQLTNEKTPVIDVKEKLELHLFCTHFLSFHIFFSLAKKHRVREPAIEPKGVN